MMPLPMLERPKMTRVMYQALKRHIVREREKKKQEQEQDAAQERLRKERELKKKKEEEDSLTLEQTKEQLQQLEAKMDSLKQEKHVLFLQLKKVLSQEEESRKKEQCELASIQQYQVAGLPINQQLFLQTPHSHRPSKYLNVTMHDTSSQGTKRPRSPSPPPSTLYTHTQYGVPYSTGSFGAGLLKQEPYGAVSEYGNLVRSEPGTYVTLAGHTYQQASPVAPSPQTGSYQASPSPATKYPGSGQSPYSTYPSPYTHHQKQLAEQFQTGYPRQPIQRRLQTGYLSPHASSSIPLQQQLEHANQKSGFSNDKFKLKQMMVSGGQPVLGQGGSIVSGYPVRPPATSYSSNTNQGTLTMGGQNRLGYPQMHRF